MVVEGGFRFNRRWVDRGVDLGCGRLTAVCVAAPYQGPEPVEVDNLYTTPVESDVGRTSRDHLARQQGERGALRG